MADGARRGPRRRPAAVGARAWPMAHGARRDPWRPACWLGTGARRARWRRPAGLVAWRPSM